jgi:hypothetical protein
MMIPPVQPGYKRAWMRCRHCGNIAYRDYVPYSLSNPVLVFPCKHGAGERDYGYSSISAEEAGIALAQLGEVSGS